METIQPELLQDTDIPTQTPDLREMLQDPCAFEKTWALSEMKRTGSAYVHSNQHVDEKLVIRETVWILSGATAATVYECSENHFSVASGVCFSHTSPVSCLFQAFAF